MSTAHLIDATASSLSCPVQRLATTQFRSADYTRRTCLVYLSQKILEYLWREHELIVAAFRPGKLFLIMSSAAPPSIPPRPVKQQAAAQGVSKLPDIPPRPQKQRGDRSISPANFPGSPLNEPYGLHKIKSPTLPARPPSVHHLPTPGEEGLEYANLQYNTNNPSSALAQDAAAQTRTIAEDLHLHAPKPSLPKASATAQVQNVTKTDTEDAVGISNGNRRTSQDDLLPTRTRSRHSFARPESAARPDSAASGDRRRSVIYGDEQGPAEIGLRVPINPLLGDVQAPTPQGLSPQVTGESPAKAHNRKRSGMQDFRPPDSYGLHGHGVIANTKFEHDWYAKHPEQLEHEEGHGHGVYESTGSGRGTYALSSDELNKIVRDTASRGAGFGRLTTPYTRISANILQGPEKTSIPTLTSKLATWLLRIINDRSRTPLNWILYPGSKLIPPSL